MAGEFSLDGFIGENKDLARGYTFYITLERDTYVTSERQKYLVKSSSLPASTNPQAGVNWQGNEYKLATTQEFADFTINYSVDVQDVIRENYILWMKEMHNPENNEHGDPAIYMMDIILEHLSHRDGSVIMTYKLIKAWPTNIGEMTLDYGSKETATFDVTFAYQWHETMS